MKTLQNKRTLITGAASGIGRAFALQLADEGAQLILVDVQREALNGVVAECTAKGAAATGLVCDLTKKHEIDQMTAAVKDRWHGIDVLINNAGIAYYGPTENMSAEQWDRLLQINLLAPIQITHAFLPGLLALEDGGHILNVNSISGLVAGGRFAAYHTSKFGLVGFTESLRAEYKRRGLGVTSLCPGPVTTNLYNAAESLRQGRTVPTPPRWICATPEKVAARGIRGIKKNNRMVMLTPLAHVLWRVNRAMPWLLDLVNGLSRKKKKKPATIPAPHIATAPVEENSRVAS